MGDSRGTLNWAPMIPRDAIPLASLRLIAAVLPAWPGEICTAPTAALGPAYLILFAFDNINKNIYCRIQGNIKLYTFKNYKPIYKYEYSHSLCCLLFNIICVQ